MGRERKEEVGRQGWGGVEAVTEPVPLPRLRFINFIMAWKMESFSDVVP